MLYELIILRCYHIHDRTFLLMLITIFLMLTVTFLTNTSSYYKNYRKTSPTSVSHYKSGDGLPKHVCQRALDCPGTKCKGLLPRVQIFRISHRKTSPRIDLISI